MLPVAETNAPQLEIWDGDSGAFWTTHADTLERVAAGYDDELLHSLPPTGRFLDVGCGTGGTTRAAAHHRPGATVLGVDLSSGMIAAARHRAAHLPNTTFLQADAQQHPFPPATFDAVISRTGTMYFGDLPAAFTNLRRCLRPGGRLAMVVWQDLAANPWLRTINTAFTPGRTPPPPAPGVPGPFALADPAHTRTLLETTGFTGVTCTGVRRPLWFGATPDAAFALLAGMAGWMLAGLPEPAVREAHRALHAALTTHATPDGVLLDSAAWLVTAVA